jgi:ferredoxin
MALTRMPALDAVRWIAQHAVFAALTYGGRLGLNLGPALPCFSCPYVSGCGGYCYLMGLQGYIGLGIQLQALWGYQGARALFWLAVFTASAAVLGKAWCGWICPFGLVSDWLAALRRALGVGAWRLSEGARRAVAPMKYALLAYLLAAPPLINLGILHSDFYLPFCRVCPGKSLMPLLVLDPQHLALDTTNPVTLGLTAVLVGFSGLMAAMMFFRDRLFCSLCPMLAILNLLRPLMLLRIVKAPERCVGCGACRRACPMGIEAVWLERRGPHPHPADCLACGRCVGACASSGALSLKFAGWTLAASSPPASGRAGAVPSGAAGAAAGSAPGAAR